MKGKNTIESTVEEENQISNAAKMHTYSGDKGRHGFLPDSPKWLGSFIRLTAKIVAICLIGVLLWRYVGNVYITHSNNMYPNIKDGDLVITYKLEDYYTNDAVLFRVGSDKQIGRIIAGPGDVVEINEDGLFTVNGNDLYETVFYWTLPADDGIQYPYTLREDEYFILNDMREMTLDSRVLGGIPRDALCGKVVIVLRHRGI